MALAAVLSAMKELILDAPELPADAVERKIFIEKNYPLLAPEEAEDLAKIKPEKLRIYTRSIFSAERDLIARNFKMTCEYLKRYWQIESGSDFDLYEIVKELHKKRPWRSTQTVELGNNFLNYISENLPIIVKTAPFLPELAEMELMLRIARRSPDDEIMPPEGLTLAEISALTVDKLLEQDFIIPSCVLFKQFIYGLIEERAQFVKSSKLPEKIEEKSGYAALGRNREGFPRWAEFDSASYAYLAAQPRKEKLPLAGWAETFIESSEAGLSEAEIFKNFMIYLAKAVESGVIVVPRR